jgi:hypothetical protein
VREEHSGGGADRWHRTERSAELTALVFNAFSPDRTAKCPHYSDRNPATVVAVKSL